MKNLLPLAPALFAGLAFPSTARAQGTVNVPGDFPTIQEAIDASTDDVVILVAPGSYGAVGIDEDHRITIQGTGERPEETTIAGSGASTVTALEFDELVLENVQLSGGDGSSAPGQRGGNIRADTGTSITLRRVIVRDGTAPQGGAGMLAVNVPSIIVQNCAFVANSIDVPAGNSILLRPVEDPLEAEISYTTFADVPGNTGAAIELENGGEAGTCSVESSIFSSSGSYATLRGSFFELSVDFLCLHDVVSVNQAFFGGATEGDNIYFRDPDFEPGEFYLPSQCSPCIDTADVADDVGDEPHPHGERPNQGFYGRTEFAQTSRVADLLLDSNGDRRVTDADEESESDTPFVFWINNDDDSAGAKDWMAADPDNTDSSIDGIRDLEDFARIRLEILCEPPPDGVEYWLKLVPDEGSPAPSIRLYDYARNDLEHLRSRRVARGMVGAPVVTLTRLDGSPTTVVGEQRVKLPDDFLDVGSPRYLIFEGVSPGSGRLEISRRILRVEATLSYGTRPAGRDSVPIRLENIQDHQVDPKLFTMCRVHPSTFAAEEVYTNFPDEVGSVTVFVHGYNVDPEPAHTSWMATFYKRLYWSGHSSHLVGINWPGNLGFVNFDDGVFNAFRSSAALAQLVDAIPATRIDFLVHSAGNIVVSDALRRIAPGTPVVHFNSMQAAIPANVFDVDTTRSTLLWLGPSQNGGLAGVDHGLGPDLTVSPWNGDQLDLTQVGSVQDINDDLWVGIYQRSVEDSPIELVQLWSRADCVLRSAYIPNSALNRGPSLFDRTSRQINLTWSYLAYRFPPRAYPYGLREVPETAQRYNTRLSRFGRIRGHSHSREKPIQTVHGFFDLLIERGLLVGTPPYSH